MTDQLIVAMGGGLDLVTPPIQIRPGYMIACSNYESEVRGYRRFTGYERLDGQPKPSEATYSILSFVSGTTAVSDGDQVTGLSSGATAFALTDGLLETGTYVGGDASGHIVIFNIAGDFVDGELLQVSGSTIATVSGLAVEGGATSDALDASYLSSAVSKRRLNIGAVPGSGPVRGAFTYKGDVFAFRDNVSASAGIMHKATAAGWATQSFGSTLQFVNGETEFLEGETLQGDFSGATATIDRVVRQDGSWDGSAPVVDQASGYLVLSNVSGAFQAGESINSVTGLAETTETQQPVTLPPGGKYRAITHNFFGVSNRIRMYVANGVGRAFEWDGSVLAPIVTGVTTSLDMPKFVGVVGGHLFLGYQGGSLQFSSTGKPLEWIANTGAGEIGLGEDLTGFKSNTKTTAIITGRNRVAYVSGSSLADFAVQSVSEDSGAIEDTLEVVGSPLLLDNIGVRDLQAVDAFGNWRIGTTTQLVEPLIRAKRESNVFPVGTLRVRSRDLYRLFYSDGSAVSIYFGRSQPECTSLQLGFVPSCFYSGEDANGDEMLLAGSDDGLVYEIDAGWSFDGDVIEAFFRTSFVNARTPNDVKRWHNAVVEVESEGVSCVLNAAADFSYGNPQGISLQEQSFTAFGSGGFWNTAVWNNFVWSAALYDDATIELNGLGVNASLVMMSDADDELPHTITSVTFNHTSRRQRRHGR